MVADVRVRPATDADVPAIRHVAQETWRATYSGHIPAGDIEAFLEGAYDEERLRATLNRPTVDVVVAIADEEVVGYVLVGVNREGLGELFAIYVLPDWQGHGAGWRLWQAAVVGLQSRDLTEMRLWVLTANESARRFYERQGAVVVDSREWPVGAGTIHETAYRLILAVRR